MFAITGITGKAGGEVARNLLAIVVISELEDFQIKFLLFANAG